jgi:hypothetical protein
MSQRLIDARQRRVLAILPSGLHIYPLVGADPAAPSTAEKTTEETPTGSTEEDVKPDPEDQGRVYTEAEYQELQRRMQAADRAKSQAEQKVTEYERAGQSEQEKLQADLATALERAANAERERDVAVMGREFLKFPGFDWHDPDTALALVDMSNVKIEDGKVTGVKEAVQKLAKEKPFLLKSQPGQTPANNGAQVGKGSPSGHNPAAKIAGGDTQVAQREHLIAKYKL